MEREKVEMSLHLRFLLSQAHQEARWNNPYVGRRRQGLKLPRHLVGLLLLVVVRRQSALSALIVLAVAGHDG